MDFGGGLPPPPPPPQEKGDSRVKVRIALVLQGERVGVLKAKVSQSMFTGGQQQQYYQQQQQLPSTPGSALMTPGSVGSDGGYFNNEANNFYNNNNNNNFLIPDPTLKIKLPKGSSVPYGDEERQMLVCFYVRQRIYDPNRPPPSATSGRKRKAPATRTEDDDYFLDDVDGAEANYDDEEDMEMMDSDGEMMEDEDIYGGGGAGGMPSVKLTIRQRPKIDRVIGIGEDRGPKVLTAEQIQMKAAQARKRREQQAAQDAQLAQSTIQRIWNAETGGKKRDGQNQKKRGTSEKSSQKIVEAAVVPHLHHVQSKNGHFFAPSAGLDFPKVLSQQPKL